MQHWSANFSLIWVFRTKLKQRLLLLSSQNRTSLQHPHSFYQTTHTGSREPRVRQHLPLTPLLPQRCKALPLSTPHFEGLCSAVGGGRGRRTRDSLRPRLKAQTNPVSPEGRQSVPGPQGTPNTKSLQKKSWCRWGGSTERDPRRNSAAQLPCPWLGTKEVPSSPKSALRTSSGSGHLPASLGPLSHSPAPASTHPAWRAAPPGHHRPCPPRGRGVVQTFLEDSDPVPGGNSFCRRVPLP